MECYLWFSEKVRSTPMTGALPTTGSGDTLDGRVNEVDGGEKPR